MKQKSKSRGLENHRSFRTVSMSTILIISYDSYHPARTTRSRAGRVRRPAPELAVPSLGGRVVVSVEGVSPLLELPPGA